MPKMKFIKKHTCDECSKKFSTLILIKKINKNAELVCEKCVRNKFENKLKKITKK